jgi:ABC-2 type transport system permease protein/lipopolysaccharide transport system permease protein
MTQIVADFREMIAEQVHSRELLYQMVKRDLLLRYKQTVMGFGWAIFMPLVNTAVFSIIFTRVAPLDTAVPYPLFAFCGLCVWNFFASSLRFGVVSLTSNPNLVSKVYFPREIFPLATTMVSFVDFLISGVVMAALMAYYGVAPTAALLLLPIVMAVHFTFTLAMAFLLAMGNLFFRDVKYLFEVILTVWMFMSSVLYPLSTLTGKAGLLMRLNPMTPIIDAYRSVLLYGQAPGVEFAGAASVALVLLAGAWLVFHRAEFAFAESL